MTVPLLYLRAKLGLARTPQGGTIISEDIPVDQVGAEDLIDRLADLSLLLQKRGMEPRLVVGPRARCDLRRPSGLYRSVRSAEKQG